MNHLFSSGTRAWLLGGLALAAAAADRPPLTVTDSIETRRIWYDGGMGYRNPVRLSPDGRRYLVILMSGDLERDGNWVEFHTGSAATLGEAGSRMAARLFTREHDVGQILQGTTFTWLADNETVAFPWNDGINPPQVCQVNLHTGEVGALATHPQRLRRVALHPAGRDLVFTADSRRPSDEEFATLVAQGFTVRPEQSLIAILEGRTQERFRDHIAEEVFIVTRDHPEPRPVPVDRSCFAPAPPILSPDGQWAILGARPGQFPPEWDRYTNARLQRQLAHLRRYPDAISEVSQYWLVDLARATARPLWNAPGSPPFIWSPDGASVLLGSTVLPVEVADADGLAGNAVVELNLASGTISRIPVPPGLNLPIAPVAWASDLAEFKSGDRSWHARKATSGWRLTDESPVPSSVKAKLIFELRQGMNEPPVVFATDPASGESREVLAINPQLTDRFALGHAEAFRWTDEKGRGWTARLYYPVDYVPGRRYPLVIQSAPPISTQPTQFSLRGSELLSCVVSIAQPLANRGILVLANVGWPDVRAPGNTIEEYETLRQGFESAARTLADRGLADPARVGLSGYSRAGSYVEYALTHATFPFAAAIAADNASHGLFSYLIFDGGASEANRIFGGPPYGENLKLWMERTPTLRADRIHTPLLLERDSGGVLAVIPSWEMFSHLRRLDKPVELYVVPDIAHGSHGLVRPRQQQAALEQAVEWFDFWLNAREDAASTKADQYRRWRQLRKLHTSDLKKRDANAE